MGSDERGGYVWDALEPGSYRLAVSATGFEPTAIRSGADEQTIIRTGASLRRDVIMTPGGAMLSGTVVDATGGPVPLALVHVVPSAVAHDPERATSEPRQLGVIVRSDEDGRFALSVRPGPIALRAEAEGYAGVTRASEAPASDVELPLLPAASLSGVVVSALDGHPLGEVEVTAYKHTPLALGPGDGRALSAADGSFTIRGLSDGAFRVSARSSRWSGSAPRQIALAVAEQGGPLRIEARPALTVAGTVQVADANEGCPRGDVYLGSGEAGSPDAFAAVAAIESSGAFRFEGVPAGAYKLRVDCEHHVERDYPVLRLQAEDLTGLRLEVDRGLTVHGQVVDTMGRALADRMVSVVPSENADGRALASTSGQDRSDRDGKFRVLGLAPGSYEVSAGEQPESTQRVELARGQARADVRLVVSGTGALRILVEGVKGHASATLAVYVGSAAGEQRAKRTSQDGTYVLRDLSAGTYRVSASDGKAPAVSREVDVSGGHEVEVRLTLRSEREVLRGRVVDLHGNPVSDAWVRASRSTVDSVYQPASGEPVLTDADGNFELTELARNETYDVEVYLTHGVNKSVSRGLRTGQTVTLQLETNPKL